jgi:hypothetical protein
MLSFLREQEGRKTLLAALIKNERETGVSITRSPQETKTVKRKIKRR